jgi:replicative superfamily II helicase
VNPNFPSITQCKPDPEGLVSLCLETVLQKGKSVIVFAPTKKWCESACGLISEALGNARQHLLRHRCEDASGECNNLDALAEEKRRQACALTSFKLADSQAGLCPILARTIQNGVSYHHAGLTADERRVTFSMIYFLFHLTLFNFI